MSPNLELKRILDELDFFEKKFKTNSEDDSLVTYLQKIFDRIKEQKMNQDELTKIQSRLILFRKLFDNKKQELKDQSSKLLKTQVQLNRYLKNSHIKNNK
jgi:hypothetical protein